MLKTQPIFRQSVHVKQTKKTFGCITSFRLVYNMSPYLVHEIRPYFLSDLERALTL